MVYLITKIMIKIFILIKYGWKNQVNSIKIVYHSATWLFFCQIIYNRKK